METIIEFMSAEHQSCDSQFALAEQSVYSGNWPAAEADFKAFRENMTRHFSREEDLLFPAILQAGGPPGPVQFMHMEHAQMNSLLDDMASALSEKNTRKYGGLAETLLILLQQHNLKEEQILYPIAERLLRNDWSALRSRMQSVQ